MAVGHEYNTGYGGGEVKHQDAAWRLSRKDMLQLEKVTKKLH